MFKQDAPMAGKTQTIVTQAPGQVFFLIKCNAAAPVLLSRPSKDGFARLDGRLGKIARLTPVFL